MSHMDRCGTTWLTCDELAFVQHLGMHREGSIKISRLVWLQGYMNVATLRHEWGKINKAAVIREAERLVRAEQRKQRKTKAA